MADVYAQERRRLWLRQLSMLQRLVRLLRQRNRFWSKRLEAAGVRSISSCEEFRRLPLLAKDELVRDQEQNPPYGTNLTYPLDRYVRLHQTSGTTGSVPLRWLDTAQSWARFVDLWVEIYRSLGVSRGDRLLFPFSFGPFIGFWGAFEAAQRLGLFCLSGGGMSSNARIRALFEHRITVLPCTPTYALHLAEVAASEGVDLAGSQVRLLIVAGEPGGSVPGVRQRIAEAWGAEVRDHWGMTEVGALGVECPCVPCRLHLLEEACIAEVLDPASGAEVEPGREGELVITTLWRDASPVLRYRTGDMVRPAPAERCRCGSYYIGFDGGILGRRDQMLFVRGNNVYPAALEDVVRAFAEVAEFEITVDRSRPLTEVTITVEPVCPQRMPESELAERVGRAIRDRFGFRVQVRVVPAGTLPRYELKARRVRFLP